MPTFVALWRENAAHGQALCAFGKGFSVKRDFPGGLDGCNQVEGLIPSGAVEALRGATAGGEGSLLVLETSLPADWQELEWERMTLSGQDLGRSVLVVHRATPIFGPPVSESNVPARLLNLFPKEELNFNKELENFVERGALRSTTRQSFANDIAGANDLFIIAHASESGLEDQGKRPYELPPASMLPARIWLLACNRSGAMDALARRLIDRGAGSVISASGDLSATEMLTTVQKWLSGARKENLASWILTNRSESRVDGGVGSLRLHGEVRLDDSGSSLWNEAIWRIEHGDEPRIPLDDDTSPSQYFSAAAAYEAPETWERTRRWMATRLLWLAERYDHSGMAKFEREMPQPQTARDYEALSGAARRLGHYPQAARYLALGLSLPTLSESDKAALLGAITNVLIDLDLPRSAHEAEFLFENCVVVDPQTRAENDFKRLDYLARIAAREGKSHVALDRMREKRGLALAKGDDSRELAGLLYLSAWAAFESELAVQSAKTVAAEVVERISAVESQQVGRGNDTTAYLIRALAAYCWAAKDGSVLPQLLRWRSFAEECIKLDDPGPWGYMLAFMYLANRADQSMFDRSMEALGRARYYLESAMFFSLAGREEDCSRMIVRFQQRREKTIAELTDRQIDLGFNPADEIPFRSNTETQSFSNPREVLAMGVLPL